MQDSAQPTQQSPHQPNHQHQELVMPPIDLASRYGPNSSAIKLVIEIELNLLSYAWIYSAFQSFPVDLHFMLWFDGILTSQKHYQKSFYAFGILAPNKYWLEFQIFKISKFQLKRGQNCGLSKLAVKKTPRPFGFEATFFASLYSESLLSGRPWFDSRTLQTLGAYNFEILGSARSKTTFFERFDLFLLV